MRLQADFWVAEKTITRLEGEDVCKLVLVNQEDHYGGRLAIRVSEAEFALVKVGQWCRLRLDSDPHLNLVREHKS